MNIGLTGSFGSGKSTVAEIFNDLGAVIIDADEIARDVAEPGGAAYPEIVKHFGKEILNEHGSLNRKKIADIVFNDKEKLNLLNSIIHPLVREQEFKLIKKFENEKLVIIMIPLLFETGFEKNVDHVIVVVVDDDIRIQRLAEKRKISRQEIENRLKNQISQKEKVKKADFIIDNSGSYEKTRNQVFDLYNKLIINK